MFENKSSNIIKIFQKYIYKHYYKIYIIYIYKNYYDIIFRYIYIYIYFVFHTVSIDSSIIKYFFLNEFLQHHLIIENNI